MKSTKKLPVLCEHRAQLIREMSLNVLFLSHMWTNHDIANHAKYKVELQLKNDKEEAAGVLLDAVEEKGTEAALQLLVKALVYTDQTKLARLLDPKLCEQFIQERAADESKMSAAHVAALTELRPKLIKELYLSEYLLSHMGTHNLMQSRVLDDIRQVQSQEEKKGLFLTRLTESGPNAFAQFVSGLEEDNQLHLAATLKKYLNSTTEATEADDDLEGQQFSMLSEGTSVMQQKQSGTPESEATVKQPDIGKTYVKQTDSANEEHETLLKQHVIVEPRSDTASKQPYTEETFVKQRYSDDEQSDSETALKQPLTKQS
jgi:hypothetical protein